jgi:hypothetical protein
VGPPAETLTRDQLLELATAIGRRFVAEGMRDHARYVREFYRGVRAGKRVLPDQHGIAWDRRFVVEWAQMLRVRPYEHDLPVRAHGARCACTAEAARLGQPATATISLTLPGGWRHECLRCEARWLVLERAQPVRAA